MVAEGCGYWGQLYQTLFESRLVVDQTALKQRLAVPQEIRAQGAAVVANYLEALEKEGATQLNEARILILGEKGAGKTCLARKLIVPNASMTTPEESTAGVDTLSWILTKSKKANTHVRIWDFAGHTVTHAVHQFFLSERCLYIIVYDGRSENRNRLTYWLNHMKNYGGDSQAIILVNKKDDHAVDIPINSLQDEYPILGSYTFSLQDDQTALERFRQLVARTIYNNPSWNQQTIPKNYFRVKAELEQFFDKANQTQRKEHITKKEFEAIAQKHEVKNPQSLLEALHALGVSLWYQNMEQYDTLVLNPEWISHGVYQIINWANNQGKHELHLSEFTKIFKLNAQRYPKRHHKFLFELMKHFELAYETEQTDGLIIPHLLNEDRPKELPNFPVGESLMLRYKTEQPLPPNTISRFIVRHHKEIKRDSRQSWVWRYGAVLTPEKSTLALVREYSQEISVSVKGQGKTNTISQLRDTLNDIFASYKSQVPLSSMLSHCLKPSDCDTLLLLSQLQ